MPVLTEADITKRLKALEGWKVSGGELTKTFKLASFPFAIEFVQQIGTIAEEVQHHPDMDIRFDKVKIALSTHDENGITEKDFDLAAQIEALLEGQDV